MEIYEQNMEVLQMCRPAFYKKYHTYKADTDEAAQLDGIESVTARDGERALVVEKDGVKYRLNSMYRPGTEAEKWCSQYDFQNLSMNILMFGIGNGLFMEKMMEKVGQDTKVYLYEPSPAIFEHLLHEKDMTGYFRNENIFFYIEGVNEKDFFFDLAARTHWSNLLTQVDCFHPGYNKLFPESYQKFSDWILNCNVTEVVNRNTGVHFAKPLTENALRNLCYVPDSNHLLELILAFPKDVPAIIVAAGPSLDKNIEELKRARGKAFILAVDTAVRSLIKHQVYFDCMITVDPQKPVSYMELPECREVPLICGLESNHEILKYHKGKKIWTRDAGCYLASLYKKYHLAFHTPAMGGSVATAAFSVCREIGFSRIVLVGQDLAYDGDITHADGQISKIGNEETTECMVDGIYGGKVRSRGDWKMYLDWFERNIARCRDELEVIDATEGGALIAGTEVMRLEEVIDSFCTREVDFNKLLREIQPTFYRQRDAVRKDLLHIEAELRGIRRRAEIAKKAAAQALELLVQAPDSEKLDAAAKEIAKSNRFIEKQRVYEILDQYIEDKAVDALQEINVMTGDEQQDKQKTYESAFKLYQIIAEAVEELKPVVQEAVELIKQQ